MQRRIETKEQWQNEMQSLNMDATGQIRHEYQHGFVSVSELAVLHDMPQWLIRCLLGMPVKDWWLERTVFEPTRWY